MNTVSWESSTCIRFPEMRHMPVDIAETDKQVIVRIELPGFKKEEINLNVAENKIEISATKRQEKVEKGEKYFRHEKKAGAIRRSFTLPTTVDSEKTKALFADGLLTILMPKSKEKKKRKKIEVK